jgi:hypothetical protein
VVKYPLIISYSPGCRGHFFAGLLFGSNVLMGTECWYDNPTDNIVTHDLRLDKLKQQYPDHSIIAFDIDTNGFFESQYLAWSKLAIGSSKTWIDLVHQTITEVEICWEKFLQEQKVKHIADYTINFSKTTHRDYICQVYHDITGKQITVDQQTLIDQYLSYQNDFSSTITDLTDPCRVAVAICKFRFCNNLGHPRWSIANELSANTPIEKLQSLLTLDNY